jgi:hypothetical protein
LNSSSDSVKQILIGQRTRNGSWIAARGNLKPARGNTVRQLKNRGIKKRLEWAAYDLQRPIKIKK